MLRHRLRRVTIKDGIFADDYKVCDQGYVVSYQNGKRSVLRHHFDKKRNRKYVTLAHNGSQYIFPIARLVAHEFCEGYEEGLEAHHINHDSSQDIWSNLKWVTQKENLRLSNEFYETKRKIKRVNKKWLTYCEKIKKTNQKNGELLGMFYLRHILNMKTRELSSIYNVDESLVSLILRGKRRPYLKKRWDSMQKKIDFC